METQPTPNPPLTAADKVVEAATWLVLLALWVLAGASYAGLPASIPIHYDGDGLPTHYDHKSTIFILPLLATVIVTSLAALGRRPSGLGYPLPLTATEAARLLRCLRLALGLVFSFITCRTIQIAHGQVAGLGAWFTCLTLVLVFGPPAYFLVRALRLGRQPEAGRPD